MKFIILVVVMMALFASVSLAGPKGKNSLAKDKKGRPVGQGSIGAKKCKHGVDMRSGHCKKRAGSKVH
ncbi:hypothetical protein Q7P37_003357 [Cladosporium fusiforme]